MKHTRNYRLASLPQRLAVTLCAPAPSLPPSLPRRPGLKGALSQALERVVFLEGDFIIIEVR